MSSRCDFDKKERHNCAGIAFIQGDSAGSSKLIEQTLGVDHFYLVAI